MAPDQFDLPAEDRELLARLGELTDAELSMPDSVAEAAKALHDWAGVDAILAELLTAEPLAALKTQIAAQPDLSITARRDLVEEALAAAEPDAIETDIQLPGWSQDLIDELSEIYADDQAEIAALTGVEFIAA